MTVREMIEKLGTFNPDAEIIVMSSVGMTLGDDLSRHDIVNVTDGWELREPHDLVSIEIVRDWVEE